MSRNLNLCIILLVLLTSTSVADTHVGGFYNEDQTWTLDGSPYTLDSNCYFSNSAVLTIEMDVEVQLNGNDLRIAHSSDATLNADHPEFFGPGQIYLGEDTDGFLQGVQYNDLQFTSHASIYLQGGVFRDCNVDLYGSSTFEAYVFDEGDLSVFSGSTFFWACGFLEKEYAVDLRGGHVDFEDGFLSSVDHPLDLSAEATFTTTGIQWTDCDRDTIMVEGMANDDWVWPSNPRGIVYRMSSNLRMSSATLTMDGIHLDGNHESFIVEDPGGRLLMTNCTTENMRITGSANSKLVLANNQLHDQHLTLYSELLCLGTTFSDASELYLLDGSSPWFKDCNFVDQTDLNFWDADTVHAEECWWDGSNGPTHPDNGTGDGIVISGSVNFTNWRPSAYDPSTDPVLFAMVPQQFPIVIPATGGSFSYDAYLFSNASVPGSGDFWIQAVLPSGGLYPVSQIPINVPSQRLVIAPTQTQTVPAGSPAGDYTYRGYVGSYPSIAVDMEDFEFTVEP